MGNSFATLTSDYSVVHRILNQRCAMLLFLVAFSNGPLSLVNRLPVPSGRSMKKPPCLDSNHVPAPAGQKCFIKTSQIDIKSYQYHCLCAIALNIIQTQSRQLLLPLVGYEIWLWSVSWVPFHLRHEGQSSPSSTCALAASDWWNGDSKKLKCPARVTAGHRVTKDIHHITQRHLRRTSQTKQVASPIISHLSSWEHGRLVCLDLGSRSGHL